MPVTDEELDLLLELSDTDAQLARIVARLADLPEQRAVEEAKERLKVLVEEGDALRVDLTTCEAEQRRHEREVEQYQTRIAHEQQRLYGGAITNAKEAKSVEAEIANAQTHIDELEGNLLDAMERGEALSAEIEERARGAEQTRAEIAELEAARDRAGTALVAEQVELEVLRDGLREKLTAEPKAAYDAVRQRVKAGVAVGELDGHSCTACRIDLPYSEVNELRDGPPLATCPSCRRLLIVRV